MANQIFLSNREVPTLEGVAGATITPGMLIMESSDSGVDPHGTENGVAAPLFAIEDSFQGNTVSTDYSATNRVFYVHAQGGDVIYALLETGNNVGIGDALVSNGLGALQKYAVQAVDEDGSADVSIQTGNVIGFATEAVNNTSGTNARLTIRVR